MPWHGERPIFNGSHTVAPFLNDILSDCDREHFIVLCLDTKNKLIGIHTAAVGVLDAAVTNPREIFKAAILLNAAAVIVAHNHPSGDSTPSKQDRALTERLCEAGKLLGITVLDHIIIGENQYYSFYDHQEFSHKKWADVA